MFVGDVRDVKPAPSSSWSALQVVYANAELLRLQVFEKFDHNSDLCIERSEVTETIKKLLKDGQLDDK